MAFIKKDAAGAMKEEAIGAINETTVDALFFHPIFLYFVLYCFTSTIK